MNNNCFLFRFQTVVARCKESKTAELTTRVVLTNALRLSKARLLLCGCNQVYSSEGLSFIYFELVVDIKGSLSIKYTIFVQQRFANG